MSPSVLGEGEPVSGSELGAEFVQRRMSRNMGPASAQSILTKPVLRLEVARAMGTRDSSNRQYSQKKSCTVDRSEGSSMVKQHKGNRDGPTVKNTDVFNRNAHKLLRSLSGPYTVGASKARDVHDPAKFKHECGLLIGPETAPKDGSVHVMSQVPRHWHPDSLRDLGDSKVLGLGLDVRNDRDRKELLIHEVVQQDFSDFLISLGLGKVSGRLDSVQAQKYSKMKDKLKAKPKLLPGNSAIPSNCQIKVLTASTPEKSIFILECSATVHNRPFDIVVEIYHAATTTGGAVNSVSTNFEPYDALLCLARGGGNGDDSTHPYGERTESHMTEMTIKTTGATLSSPHAVVTAGISNLTQP
ncbi:uncharacterized protein EDB91DRAFT_1337841 [Suillus paluster]|uniref:uncharacterized protein n=1 Tax=Suillus paluster TaxID=48578 RepID=UPI001B86273B|nr:uncharacterized protein EDB91DRAFT_1337841 [Suillus paluster]KAG1734698.1 hypothetical protein EDB91DRAFT_1337841 [Suillus paluster]